MEKQSVVLGDGTDADVVAFAEDPLEAAVQVFYVRGGRVRGQRGWVVEKVEDADDRRPRRALPAAGLRRRDAVTRCRARCWCRRCRRTRTRSRSWLGELRGGPVSLRVPQRGDKRALMETVARNAGQSLALHKTRRGSDLTARSQALAGDPGGARARRGAAAHRVLRRVPPAGERGRRVDGRLRGRPRPQERVPPVRHPRAGRDRSGAGVRRDVASIHEVISRRFRRLVDERARTGDLEATAEGAGVDSPEVPVGDRPRDRPAAQVRLRAQPGRRRRRRAAGRRGAARARRARRRRRRALRAGEAARGGVAAGRGAPGGAAAHQRRALPPAAGPRRGAPLRDHPPPQPTVPVDDGQRAGRRPGPGRDPAQGAAASTSAP